MVEKHEYSIVDEANPPIPTRVIGDLLVHQTGAHRGPQVNVASISDADEPQSLGELASASIAGA